jgi:CheY-like chemotaxis protein
VTNDILDLSKIEAGRLAIECIPFDITATIKEIIAWFAIRAKAKGLTLDCILPAESAMSVRGDPGRLRQILTNLIGNAIKFTETGKVAVRMEVVGAASESVTLKFYVEDTGIGISSDNRGRIFQPFMQGDSSTTRRYGGTGLGLAISKQLAELLGGEIGVDSVRGRGSTFWFSAVFEKQRVEAPAKAQPVAAAEPGREPEVASQLDGIRVLLVAGGSAKPSNLRETLTSWGCEVDQLSGAAWIVPELRLAAQTGVPFHVALLDIDLPDLDISIGLEVASDLLVFDTDLIAMTGNCRPEDDARLREGGFSACLAKPVSPADLHRALASVWRTDAEYAAAVSPAAAGRAKQPVEEPPRVLLAEDNLVNQKLVLRLLEKVGLKADVVANGSQAVAAIGKATYDLILMDCQMPEMDGFEATAEIRRLEGNARHTTICALTAHAMAGDRERCIDAGMDDYISKPLTVGVLHNKIEHWIHPKRTPGNGNKSFATA